MTPEEYERYRQRDREHHDRMQRGMEECMADVAELADSIARHPLPWTWGMAKHDGWFIQFFDADGAPCLGNDLREPEYAAFLLTLINSLSKT